MNTYIIYWEALLYDYVKYIHTCVHTCTPAGMFAYMVLHVLHLEKPFYQGESWYLGMARVMWRMYAFIFCTFWSLAIRGRVVQIAAARCNYVFMRCLFRSLSIQGRVCSDSSSTSNATHACTHVLHVSKPFCQGWRWYWVATTHRMPDLCRSFSAKEPQN